MKKLLIGLLLLMMMVLPQSALPETVDPEEAAAVNLVVFLFDPCGGCGSNNLGCGECKDTVRYHDVIRQQMGDRLYDGSIFYRMYNCKIAVNEDTYKEYREMYGCEEDILPAIFLGAPEDGIVLHGEESLQIVAETLDQYLAGGDEADGL